MQDHRLKGFEPVELEDPLDAGKHSRGVGAGDGEIVRAVCTCGLYKSGPGVKAHAFKSWKTHSSRKTKAGAHKR